MKYIFTVRSHFLTNVSDSSKVDDIDEELECMTDPVVDGMIVKNCEERLIIVSQFHVQVKDM